MELFATKGYPGTSVADIERAAGLTPRASGMYRHFPSKQAVLEAGLGDQMDALRALHAIDPPPVDTLTTREWLTLIARVGLTQLRNERALIRILYRDLEAFPDVLEEVKEHLIRPGYRDFTERLRAAQAEGRVAPGLDLEAFAAVAVGAVVNHGVFLAMLDEPPGGVDEDRFVAAWVHMVETAVAP